MRFYRDAPQRKAALAAPTAKPPADLPFDDPPLPIDDSDGGCDTGDQVYSAWKRQHPAIEIHEDDVISDDGHEVYNVLLERGIGDIFIMGVHTNMCVLHRSFAIKQMTRWGMRTVLVRDLTDAMYDPADKPYVSHDEGTGLVVEYIERHWAPSVLSADLIAAFRRSTRSE
jgi:hypothetical protein